MNHVELLASGDLAVEFRPKYHDRNRLRQILESSFPSDYNFDDFDEIEPLEDPNGSVWFKAHLYDNGEVSNEWTFWYDKNDEDLQGLPTVQVDEFNFNKDPDQIEMFDNSPENINRFLDRYA